MGIANGPGTVHDAGEARPWSGGEAVGGGKDRRGACGPGDGSDAGGCGPLGSGLTAGTITIIIAGTADPANAPNEPGDKPAVEDHIRAMIRILLPVIIAAAWGFAMWRIALWRLTRDLTDHSEPIDDPELEAAIRRLGRQVGIDHLQAHLYRMDAVNGLAAPDGRVFITSGLFDRYRRREFTAAELTSVIAHELGHVARGHARRRMIDWTGQNAARMALGMILSRFIPVIGHYIAALLSNLFLARLSRRDEFEADEYAAALMTKAGFGVGPQISMFEKLQKLTPGGQGVVWLRSHPPTKERIAAVRERSADWSPTEAG